MKNAKEIRKHMYTCLGWRGRNMAQATGEEVANEIDGDVHLSLSTLCCF